MKNNYLLYKNGKHIEYASSIAATWIWAPAIFVASSIAHNDGIYGLLWFLIPNMLTLIIFGYVSRKTLQIVSKESITLSGIAELSSKHQKTIHIFVSICLLICSSCVQFIGIHTVLSSWFHIPKAISWILGSTICVLIVFNNGLGSCIRSDVIKYFGIAFISVILLIFTYIGLNEKILIFGINNATFGDVAISFGIVSSIGLISAPYVDQTFWQRVFSIRDNIYLKNKIFYIFLNSSLMFGIIPFMFGIIGLLNTYTGDLSWQITDAFSNNFILSALLALAVILALVSTLDSNLCALSSYVYEIRKDIFYLKLSMLVLLVVSGSIFMFTDIGITQLFLIYGTIRTCIFIPTILIVFGKFNTNRLLLFTLLSVIIAPIGYICFSGTEHGFWFTILGLLLPLGGLSLKSKI